ncbi:LOW QUALITY PROTEIN: hypothetical protein JCM24511_09568 [Saitozyma sp. JCM 24511]|nr:LOW QUALITY PROTEIN: hypothetical protein JCM24511_09568 [Saitozyma sp. JCM 24511]
MTPSPTRSGIAPSSTVSVSLQPLRTSSTTASRVPTIRHDSFLNNPAADVIVVSSDRVVFRCFAWDLQRTCPLVELAQLPKTAKGSKSWSSNAPVIRTFLPLATTDPNMAAAPIQLPLEHLCSLLDLCTRCGVEKGIKACLDSMGCQAKEDPWKVFEIASKRDDVQLSRMALRAMKLGGGEKDIAPAYHFELLRLLHIHKSTPILTDPFTAAIIASPRPPRPQEPTSPLKPVPIPTRSTAASQTLQTTPTRRPRLLRAPPSSMLPEKQIVPRHIPGEVDWARLAEEFDPWRK